MTRKVLTVEEALGPQNRGAVLDPLLRTLSQEQLKDIYEWRKDILGKVDPRIGLQFAPDSPMPWLNPTRMKLNLGTYRQFSVESWITVSDPSDPERHRSEFCMPLHLVKVKNVDFLYAPFVLNKVPVPLEALRNWRDCLKPTTGIACVVIEDQGLRIKKGLPFDTTVQVLYEKNLRDLMLEAGFVDLCKVNFDRFDLCGKEDYYVGFFGYMS